MKKILELQQKLTPGNDKLGHFFWGFWYALFGVLMYFIFGWIWWIVLPSIALAASKEIRDSFGYGNPELWDFIATIVPSITTLILILIIR